MPGARSGTRVLRLLFLFVRGTRAYRLYSRGSRRKVITRLRYSLHFAILWGLINVRYNSCLLSAGPAFSLFPRRVIYGATRKLSHLSSLASRLGSFLSRSLSLWPSAFFVLDFDLASLLATLCSPPRSVTTTTAALSLQDCAPGALEDVDDGADAARLLV